MRQAVAPGLLCCPASSVKGSCQIQYFLANWVAATEIAGPCPSSIPDKPCEPPESYCPTGSYREEEDPY
jgi:hypothetical protein